MTTLWSRWLLGGWAIATAVWVMLATLMLVQTLPTPAPRTAEGALVGDSGPAAPLDQAMRGGAGGRIAGKQHLGTVVLIVLLPPAVLLLLVLGAIKLAGHPFRSPPPAARARPPSAKG